MESKIAQHKRGQAEQYGDERRAETCAHSNARLKVRFENTVRDPGEAGQIKTIHEQTREDVRTQTLPSAGHRRGSLLLDVWT